MVSDRMEMGAEVVATVVMVMVCATMRGGLEERRNGDSTEY